MIQLRRSSSSLRLGGALAAIVFAWSGLALRAWAADSNSVQKYDLDLNTAGQKSPEERRDSLQKRILEAEDGETILVQPGVIRGPLLVSKSVVLQGDRTVIDGRGTSQVVRVDAAGVTLRGFTIQASGEDLGGPDACLYLSKKATSAQVLDNVFRKCAFGIWVHETDRARIEGNRVFGAMKGHRSERGNGIHLFNASHLVIRNNHITGGRDGIYVSATEDSLIEGNRLEQGRYGVHYMFSYDNHVRKNNARNNMTGYALMESHNIVVTDNIAAQNKERGILFRDVQYCTIERNRVTGNGEGLFFFSSTENRIVDNEISGNRVGARIWAGTLRNEISKNRFVNNAQQIFYVGSSDLVLGSKSVGNFWSDYLGWDQDGNGEGDRPYRVDSFSTRLTHRFPAANLLLRSPALELLAHLQEDLPLLSVPTVIDKRPLVSKGAP